MCFFSSSTVIFAQYNTFKKRKRNVRVVVVDYSTEYLKRIVRIIKQSQRIFEQARGIMESRLSTID